MINKELIEKSIRNILIALGDDPEREGLKETPKRVAKMYEEVFEGMNYTNEEIAKNLVNASIQTIMIWSLFRIFQSSVTASTI